MSTADFKAAVRYGTPAATGRAAGGGVVGGQRQLGRGAQVVQDDHGKDAAWIHAYLHRVEGDLGNAGYWYRQAGKPVATGSLEAEWEAIVSALIGSERIRS